MKGKKKNVTFAVRCHFLKKFWFPNSLSFMATWNRVFLNKILLIKDVPLLLQNIINNITC